MKTSPAGMDSVTFLLRVIVSMLVRSLYVFILFKAPLLSYERLSAVTVLFSVFGVNVLLEFLYSTIAVTVGIGIRSSKFELFFVLVVRLLMVFIYAVVRWFYKDEYRNIARKTIHFLFILSLGILFTAALWLYNNEQSHLWFIMMLLVAIVSILVIRLLYESAAKKREQEHAKLLSLQNELMIERLEGDKRLMDAVHQTRHDLQKHLDYVHSLLDDARTYEAQRYIQQITKPVKVDAAPVRTGCPAIDTVLQIEQSKASAQGITMEIVAHSLPENCIIPADSNCILGNLLDNAIEAQAAVPEEERHIQVSIRQKHDFLMIHIKNTVKENPLLHNEKLRTTKKEHQHLHGIGLKSVEATVMRYAVPFRFYYALK